jgi:cobalamin biosynthesis protein CbiG
MTAIPVQIKGVGCLQGYNAGATLQCWRDAPKAKKIPPGKPDGISSVSDQSDQKP